LNFSTMFDFPSFGTNIPSSRFSIANSEEPKKRMKIEQSIANRSNY
jgi:hypothetical protein